MELYPLTMCYFIERTQKCTKLFFNHYFNAAYIEDGNTFGINSRRYLCHVVGRELGSWGGRIGGAALGGLAGSGAGSVPLGIAGGIAGDYYGGEFGGWLSDTIFDFFEH
nr:hypothetical protein [Prevotella sp.]